MDAAYGFLTANYDPDDRTVTPESLAWNLVMGEEIDDFSGIMSQFVSDESGSTGANRHQQLADEFQILIITYMEMVFHILKTNYMASLIDDSGDVLPDVDLEKELDNFKPDLSMYSTDDMCTIYREKLAKIRYFLSVRDITDYCDDDPNDFGIDNKYYCKILLLDDGRSKTRTYFRNATHIPPHKRYTFLIRPDEHPKQDKLDDFYAVGYLPVCRDDSDTDTKTRKIRIAFSKINVISSDPHIAP